MIVTDRDLQEELQAAKEYLARLNGNVAEIKESVVQRAEFQVEIVVELILWRASGKKWLEQMNAGGKNGKVQ